MSRIAAEIGTVAASPRTTKNRQHIDDLIDELVWIRRMHRDACEHGVKVEGMTV